mgnify:CR=1 FL=1
MGATIAVLGSGPDVDLSARARESRARDRGGTVSILSELAPGTPPQPQFFRCATASSAGCRARSWSSRPGEKSGSLITARSALDQGRDVLAVPGQHSERRAIAAATRCCATVQEIVESADDILEELGFPPGSVPAASNASDRWRTADVIAADRVLACSDARRVRAIWTQSPSVSGLAVARLLPRLFELELQGAGATREEAAGSCGLTDRVSVKDRTWQKLW